MNKVCFDINDKIIGFNINNCYNFINIDDVDNIYKIVYDDKVEEKLDTFGRKIFIKQHKAMRKSMQVALMTDNDFEDNDFIYKKQYEIKKAERKSYLTSESNNFSFEDIINEKCKQLVNKYSSNECLLFETFNNEIFNNDLNVNCIIGKTFIRLNEESVLNISLNIDKHSQILIYCETDNNIDIKLKDNIVCAHEYIRHSSKKINLTITAKNNTNIYSFGILIK